MLGLLEGSGVWGLGFRVRAWRLQGSFETKLEAVLAIGCSDGMKYLAFQIAIGVALSWHGCKGR